MLSVTVILVLQQDSLVLFLISNQSRCFRCLVMAYCLVFTKPCSVISSTGYFCIFFTTKVRSEIVFLLFRLQLRVFDSLVIILSVLRSGTSCSCTVTHVHQFVIFLCLLVTVHFCLFSNLLIPVYFLYNNIFTSHEINHIPFSSLQKLMFIRLMQFGILVARFP